MMEITKKLNINKEIQNLKKQKSSYWLRKSNDLALNLFRFAHRTVPAYKKFLKKNKINSRHIKTIEEFKKLPITSKENYLKKYPYSELFPRGGLFDSITFSATSGSSGEPFFFPRQEIHDQKYELAARIFFEDQFETKKKKTLVIIGFGLGVWIGGIMTYKILYQMATNGHKLSIIPVGPNKEMFIKMVKKFSHLYEQTILMGYPPFIKEVLDDGPLFGIKWGKYNVKIFTAAEGFTEKFREYIGRKAKLKNSLSDIINLYGTVELGIMGHETAFANLIRHIAVKNQRLFKELFPEAMVIPTFVQYYPHQIFFEKINGNIVASGYGSSIPLIRYIFPDLGGVITFKEVLVKLKKCGIDIKKELKKYKIKSNILPLPFVYVYTRSDSAVSFVGIVLYPEYFKVALQNKRLEKYTTGKFTVVITCDKNQNQLLEFNVELRRNIKKLNKICKMIEISVNESLRKYSTEYNYLYSGASSTYKKQLTPKVILWQYGYQVYFKSGIKQQWIKRN